MNTRENHWRTLERLYLSAPTNVYYQPTIRVGDGTAEISITVRPDFFHTAKAVHGSVYFKLLDDAGFFASNSLVEDVFVLTADFTTHLLRPVSSGVLTATGKVIHVGARQLLAEANVFDSEQRLVGHGIGTYVKSKILLSSLITEA